MFVRLANIMTAASGSEAIDSPPEEERQHRRRHSVRSVDDCEWGSEKPDENSNNNNNNNNVNRNINMDDDIHATMMSRGDHHELGGGHASAMLEPTTKTTTATTTKTTTTNTTSMSTTPSRYKGNGGGVGGGVGGGGGAHSDFSVATSRAVALTPLLPNHLRSAPAAATAREELERQRLELDQKLARLDRKAVVRRIIAKPAGGPGAEGRVGAGAGGGAGGVGGVGVGGVGVGGVCADAHSVVSVHTSVTAPSSSVASNGSGEEHICRKCTKKDIVIEKQELEIMELRHRVMKLEGIPVQISCLPKKKNGHQHDDASHASSGVTNHVAPASSNLPGQDLRTAVLVGTEAAFNATNTVEGLDWTMPGNDLAKLPQRQGTYYGTVSIQGVPDGPDGRIVFDNGDEYAGPFRDGLMHGENGRFCYVSGDTYTGSYWHGMRHGQGEMFYPARSTYVGEYRFDMPWGYGVKCLEPTGTVFHDGVWEAGKPVLPRMSNAAIAKRTKNTKNAKNTTNSKTTATAAATTTTTATTSEKKSRRTKRHGGRDHHRNRRSKSSDARSLLESRTVGGESRESRAARTSRSEARHSRKKRDDASAVSRFSAPAATSSFTTVGTASTASTNRRSRRSRSVEPLQSFLSLRHISSDDEDDDDDAENGGAAAKIGGIGKTPTFSKTRRSRSSARSKRTGRLGRAEKMTEEQSRNASKRQIKRSESLSRPRDFHAEGF